MGTPADEVAASVAARRGTGKHCRPVFIGAGTLETGDGWVDPKGSFLAAAAGPPVWSLLGRRGLTTMDFPPVLAPVTDGEIGFRQHQGGHNNRDNWPVHRLRRHLSRKEH